MALLYSIRLSDPDKLDTLRRLDQFRRWRSLEENRFCLCCSEIITGHDIQVIGEAPGTGLLRLVCPTESCSAIPMDWILPTKEILDRRRSARATIDGDRSPRRNLTYNATGLPPDCRGDASPHLSTYRHD